MANTSVLKEWLPYNDVFITSSHLCIVNYLSFMDYKKEIYESEVCISSLKIKLLL